MITFLTNDSDEILMCIFIGSNESKVIIGLIYNFIFCHGFIYLHAVSEVILQIYINSDNSFVICHSHLVMRLVNDNYILCYTLCPCLNSHNRL